MSTAEDMLWDYVQRYGQTPVAGGVVCALGPYFLVAGTRLRTGTLVRSRDGSRPSRLPFPPPPRLRAPLPPSPLAVRASARLPLPVRRARRLCSAAGRRRSR